MTDNLKINSDMRAAPDEALLVMECDSGSGGIYLVSGWRSLRAWRTEFHVTADPLGWIEGFSPSLYFDEGQDLAFAKTTEKP